MTQEKMDSPIQSNATNSDDSFYVLRSHIVSQFVDWQAKPEPQFRMRSLTGPPGSGKSIVLRQLFSQLKREGRRVLKLDLSEVTGSNESLPERLPKWLRDDLVNIDTFVASIYDPNAPFEVLWRWTIEYLCFSKIPLTLLVDSYDEVSSDEKK